MRIADFCIFNDDGCMRFTKMQGAGNDYVYVNCMVERVNNPEQLAITVSNRNFGIGSDGLVLICPSEVADFRMRMFNADGSESQMCGNASRCVGKYVYEKGLTSKECISLETLAGIKYLNLAVKDGKVETITVDMGIPELKPEKIPVKAAGDMFVNRDVDINGHVLKMTCVSMGNPHAVIFVEDMDEIDIPSVGKMIENHCLFPEKTNVEFVQALQDDRFKMRVWERGAGETLACGTGACAALVAAILSGCTKQQQATIQLRGGNLDIQWDAETKHVFMTGGAIMVFEGEIFISD